MWTTEVLTVLPTLFISHILIISGENLVDKHIYLQAEDLSSFPVYLFYQTRCRLNLFVIRVPFGGTTNSNSPEEGWLVVNTKP